MNKLASLPLTLLLLAPLALLQAATDKPNIIFVLFDDRGYGQPKCYREGTEFKTPNLNRLAREDMRFTDAHAAASTRTSEARSCSKGVLQRSQFWNWKVN